MGVEPFLGGLVVVGRDHQRGIGAGRFGVLGELDCLGGGIGAGARDDGHTPARGLDAELGHAHVFGVGERRRFPRSSYGDETVGTLGNVPFHEVLKGFFVDGTVLERCHQRDDGALEHG